MSSSVTENCPMSPNLAAVLQLPVAGSAQFVGTGGLWSSLPGPSGAAQLACWLSLIWETKFLTAGKARSGRSRKMV